MVVLVKNVIIYFLLTINLLYIYRLKDEESTKTYLYSYLIEKRQQTKENQSTR